MRRVEGNPVTEGEEYRKVQEILTEEIATVRRANPYGAKEIERLLTLAREAAGDGTRRKIVKLRDEIRRMRERTPERARILVRLVGLCENIIFKNGLYEVLPQSQRPEVKGWA